MQPEGRVDVSIGTLSSGQGHETSFAQCVAEWLGVDVDSIRLIQGDTDIMPVGGGSHSARSMRMGGIVMGKASQAVIAEGARKIAGHVLETDPADVAFAEGRFTVKGTDRSIGLFEVARAARERNDLPDDLRGPLAAESDEFIRDAPAFRSAARSARSRSTPTPGMSRSCATPPSTTSAAPSIR